MKDFIRKFFYVSGVTFWIIIGSWFLWSNLYAATVSVRVGVEFVDPVNFAQQELIGERVIHETNSPYCEIDERGVVCQ